MIWSGILTFIAFVVHVIFSYLATRFSWLQSWTRWTMVAVIAMAAITAVFILIHLIKDIRKGSASGTKRQKHNEE